MRVAHWMCALGVSAFAVGCGGGASGTTTSGESSSRSTSGKEVELHEHPTKEELAEVLGEQAAHIRECGMGKGETVKVEIVFDGESGQAVEINYPEDVNRSVRICIQSNLVHAVVHPFKRDRYTVTYPFKLRQPHNGAPTVNDDD
jgi:hypothetical protein